MVSFNEKYRIIGKATKYQLYKKHEKIIDDIKRWV